MKVNRYAAPCENCGDMVPAGQGNLARKGNGGWAVTHLDCYADDGKVSHEFYFPSTGNYAYINKNGRCEDAPCCGCCTA